MRQFRHSKATIMPWFAPVSLLLGCLVLPACAPTVTVTAPVSKITAAVVDDLVCRTSNDNSVADMPGTFKSFVQGGDSPQSIVVTFVGSWAKPTSGGRGESEARGSSTRASCPGSR